MYIHALILQLRNRLYETFHSGMYYKHLNTDMCCRHLNTDMCCRHLNTDMCYRHLNSAKQTKYKSFRREKTREGTGGVGVNSVIPLVHVHTACIYKYINIYIHLLHKTLLFSESLTQSPVTLQPVQRNTHTHTPQSVQIHRHFSPHNIPCL